MDQPDVLVVDLKVDDVNDSASLDSMPAGRRHWRWQLVQKVTAGSAGYPPEPWAYLECCPQGARANSYSDAATTLHKKPLLKLHTLTNWAQHNGIVVKAVSWGNLAVSSARLACWDVGCTQAGIASCACVVVAGCIVRAHRALCGSAAVVPKPCFRDTRQWTHKAPFASSVRDPVGCAAVEGRAGLHACRAVTARGYGQAVGGVGDTVGVRLAVDGAEGTGGSVAVDPLTPLDVCVEGNMSHSAYVIDMSHDMT